MFCFQQLWLLTLNQDKVNVFLIVFYGAWKWHYGLIKMPGNLYLMYRNIPKYRDMQSTVNSINPDQMLRTAASDLGLRCLPLSPAVFRLL